MAITVNQTPADGYSIHYPLWHVVNTDNLSPSLRCIFDIYIGGVMISRHRVFPPPGITVNGYFDAAPIVRNYVKGYYNPAISVVAINTNDIYVEYQVKYGEEYLSGGNVVQVLNQHTSTHKAYNCYPEAFAPGVLNVMSGWGHKFLTERDPNAIEIPYGDVLYLPYLKGANPNASLRVVTWDTLGNNVALVTSASIAINQLVVYAISPAIINAIAPGAMPANLAYYTVSVRDGATFTPALRVTISCSPKTKPLQLHFLNRLGGLETFSFSLVNRQELELEKQFYGQSGWLKTSVSPIPNPPDPSFYTGAVRNFDPVTKVYYPTQTQYATRHINKYKLLSNYVNETDYRWLKQLIASPVVYMSVGDYLYPVTIQETKWTEKRVPADKMFNLELTVQTFHNINSQYQ